MADIMMGGDNMQMADPNAKMQQWQRGGWDSGIQSGATTATHSVTGQSHHNDDYPDTAQVLNEWNREFTMEEANRKFLRERLIKFIHISSS